MPLVNALASCQTFATKLFQDSFEYCFPTPPVMNHPLDLLPARVWYMTASYLPPQDIYNFAHASEFWYDLTKPLKDRAAFQLVLPHLGDLLAVKKQKIYDDHPRYLSLQDLLNIRFACKSWNHAVEDYFQHHVYEEKPLIDDRNLTGSQFYGRKLERDLSPRKIPFYTSDHYLEIRFAEMDEYKSDVFKPGDGLRRWLDSAKKSHPRNTDANPILSRDIHIPADVEREDTSDDVTHMLECYGKHLLRCSIDLCISVPIHDLYEMLRDWLSLTPNLKSLSISAGILGWLPDASTTTPKLLDKLQVFMQDHPLPELPHLSTLELSCIPQPIQDVLLHTYKNVEKLSLRLNNWRYQNYQTVNLENLRTLQLSTISCLDFLAFEKCAARSWSGLRTLEMDFTGHKWYQYIQRSRPEEKRLTTSCWSEIIKFLNTNFQNASNLFNLTLCLPHHDKKFYNKSVLQDTKALRLQLKNVQQLKLRSRNACNLDFITPMASSLRKLAVEYMPDDTRDFEFPPNDIITPPANNVHYYAPADTVKWNTYLDRRLLDSNLWTYFSGLNFVRVEGLKGWSYRRRRNARPVFIRQDGTEERNLNYFPLKRDHFSKKHKKWNKLFDIIIFH